MSDLLAIKIEYDEAHNALLVENFATAYTGEPIEFKLYFNMKQDVSHNNPENYFLLIRSQNGEEDRTNPFNENGNLYKLEFEKKKDHFLATTVIAETSFGKHLEKSWDLTFYLLNVTDSTPIIAKYERPIGEHIPRFTVRPT
jgi:hypothetical protein